MSFRYCLPLIVLLAPVVAAAQGDGVAAPDGEGVADVGRVRESGFIRLQQGTGFILGMGSFGETEEPGAVDHGFDLAPASGNQRKGNLLFYLRFGHLDLWNTCFPSNHVDSTLTLARSEVSTS